MLGLKAPIQVQKKKICSRNNNMLEEPLQTIYTTLTTEGALKYWAIPFVAAAVGWATNWVAIQMTFWPIPRYSPFRLARGGAHTYRKNGDYCH